MVGMVSLRGIGPAALGAVRAPVWNHFAAFETVEVTLGRGEKHLGRWRDEPLDPTANGADIVACRPVFPIELEMSERRRAQQPTLLEKVVVVAMWAMQLPIGDDDRQGIFRIHESE